MQNLQVTNTYMTVSFKDKDAAKALGARWDGIQRQWFVPEGRELTPFQQWLPAGSGQAFLPVSTALSTDHLQSYTGSSTAESSGRASVKRTKVDTFVT